MGAFLANASSVVRDRLARAFPLAYTTKHDHRRDFGWPENIQFGQYHSMYCRNSLANAAVDKTIAKCWETLPALWEQEDSPAETTLEIAIAKHFSDKGIWRAFMQTDRRSMVGAYAGALILVRDGKKLNEPVDRAPLGITSIAGVIPIWEGQLRVSMWDSDPMSETYAKPLLFEFTEAEFGNTDGKPQTPMTIHASRILIWSEDGTVDGRSDLEPGFNDLIDAEKVRGAGGEGFWKTSRGAPVIEVNKEISPEDIKRMLGSDGIQKLDEKVDNFNSGFDKMLLLGGMTATPLTITLPQPEEFWTIAVQGFAASMQIPFKVLVGNITGERASTEDEKGWARACMSRRMNVCIPMLQEFVRRMVAWGILPPKEWAIGWASLLDATPDEMLERAIKMAEIDAKRPDERVFLPDEIREMAGFAPSEDVDGWDEFIADRDAVRDEAAEDVEIVEKPE